MPKPNTQARPGLSRRQFVSTAAAGLAAGALGSATVAQETDVVGKATSPRNEPHCGRYNILFILVDQERWPVDEAVSLPGHQRLRRDGVTFTNHRICSAVCTPSRSNIHTGQHIVHTGMFDNTNFPWQADLSTDIPTIGHMLRQADYYTAYSGKFHLAEGFDQKLGYDMRNLGREMEKYGFSDFYGPGDVIGHDLGGYRFDHMVAGAAIAWLRGRGAELKAKGQPWMLAVNLVNPHDIMFLNTDEPGQNVQNDGKVAAPIRRPPDHAIYRESHDVPLPESLRQPLDEPGRPKAHAEYKKCHDTMLGAIPPEDERWKKHQDYYFNCIRDVDAQLDRVLQELDDRGLADETIVIYTSDHGELGGQHGLRGKGSCVYQRQLRVPMIVRHPAYPSGATCSALTCHVDLVPTMLSLAGLDTAKRRAMNDRLVGHDLSPLLRGPQTAAVDAVRDASLFTFNMFSYLDGDFFAAAVEAMVAGNGEKSTARPDLSRRGAVRSVFDGRYTFARYFAPTQHHRPTTLEQLTGLNDLELYDLRNDPAEMRNLAAKPSKHADLIMAMNAKLNALIDKEIGPDKGQMLPRSEGVDWAMTQLDP